MTLEEKVAHRLMDSAQIVCTEGSSGYKWEAVCPYCGNWRHLIIAERDNLIFACSCGKTVRLIKCQREMGIYPPYNIRKWYESEGKDWRHLIKHFSPRRP